MSSRKVVLTHNGTDYTAQLATITSTHFGLEGHGILTASLIVEGDHWGQSVGGMVLTGKPTSNSGERIATAYGLDFLMKIMHTVGVDRWEQLPGRQVLVVGKGVGTIAQGIAHAIDEDRVMIFDEHSANFNGEQVSA